VSAGLMEEITRYGRSRLNHHRFKKCQFKQA
jgi:hypothetical protein